MSRRSRAGALKPPSRRPSAAAGTAPVDSNRRHQLDGTEARGRFILPEFRQSADCGDFRSARGARGTNARTTRTNRLRFAVLRLAALALAGCNETVGQKQGLGTLLGAVAGGVAGAQVGKLVVTGVGAALGALIGSEVGKSLDRADRLAMQHATQNTLETAPSGTTSSWSNPDSGNSGTVTPTQTYQRSDGAYCREFHPDGDGGQAHAGSQRHRLPQSDGSWQIIWRGARHPRPCLPRCKETPPSRVGRTEPDELRLRGLHDDPAAAPPQQIAAARDLQPAFLDQRPQGIDDPHCVQVFVLRSRRA